MSNTNVVKLETILHDYQKDAIEFINDSEGVCALWLPMGAGKTLITLSYIHLADIKSVLILAPVRVAQYTWPSEIEKWDSLFNLKSDYVVARDTNELKRIEAIYEDKRITIINHDMIAWLRKVCWDKTYDLIIVDESSAYKDQKTSRFRALRDFATEETSSKIIMLSGTPNPTSYTNLWPQYKILDGGQRLFNTYKRYIKTFFFFAGDRYYLKSRAVLPLGHPRQNENALWGLRAEDLIKELVKDITMSLTSIPSSNVELIEQTLTFELNKSAQSELINIINEYEEKEQKDENGGLSIANKAVFVLKCHQVCNGAVYHDNKKYSVIHNDKLNLLEDLLESIKESDNDNVMLMYQFEHDKARILKHFGEKYGIELFNDRKGSIERWNNKEISVMLCHPKTMAHGLNLQEGGHTVIWFGLPFSLELYLQSNARLARPGQSETVRIYRLASNSDVDQEICKRLHMRQSMMQDFVNYFRR